MFKFTSRKRNRNRPAYTPRREKASRITRNPRAGKGPGARAAAWLGKVDWGRLRINVVVCIFCLLWVGLWGRAWYLQMVEGPRLADRARRQHMASELVSGRRGMIYDRNGQVLARSVEARSVYAKPQDVEDFLVMANTLGPILGIAPQKLYDELSKSKRRFVWLRRKVDDYTAEAVRKANLPGIGLSKEYDRVYPFKHMAGQLLGFVGLDDKGLEGIERSLEARLGCIPTRQIVQRDAMGRRFYLHEEGQTEPRGQDVTLTIDVQMQFIAEEAVARAARDYDARWSGALVVDVPTGDILAWAQYPFFNPNTYRESSPLIYRNRLAADALEPGSTFKPFVMAAALQERKITPNTLIDCERQVGQQNFHHPRHLYSGHTARQQGAALFLQYRHGQDRPGAGRSCVPQVSPFAGLWRAHQRACGRKPGHFAHSPRLERSGSDVHRIRAEHFRHGSANGAGLSDAAESRRLQAFAPDSGREPCGRAA